MKKVVNVPSPYLFGTLWCYT